MIRLCYSLAFSLALQCALAPGALAVRPAARARLISSRAAQGVGEQIRTEQRELYQKWVSEALRDPQRPRNLTSGEFSQFLVETAHELVALTAVSTGDPYRTVQGSDTLVQRQQQAVAALALVFDFTTEQAAAVVPAEILSAKMLRWWKKFVTFGFKDTEHRLAAHSAVGAVIGAAVGAAIGTDPNTLGSIMVFTTIGAITGFIEGTVHLLLLETLRVEYVPRREALTKTQAQLHVLQQQLDSFSMQLQENGFNPGSLQLNAAALGEAFAQIAGTYSAFNEPITQFCGALLTPPASGPHVRVEAVEDAEAVESVAAAAKNQTQTNSI